MATSKTVQLSFAGGEISPDMYGRKDDTRYQNGLAKCQNFICLPQGPIRNRPGFEFVNEAGNESKPVRLIPFTYSAGQTMIVELGDKYARFHSYGASLVNDDGTLYQIATPWAAEDLFDLVYVQSGDIVTFVSENYPPTELRRYGARDWRIHTVQINTKLATPTNVQAVRATAAADDPNADKYTFKYRVSCLNADKTEESEASAAVSVVANLYSYGTTVKISCNTVAGASFYRFYKNQGGLYGYIGDSETPEIIDDNITPKTDTTNRRFDDVFNTSAGIRSVTMTAQGSGYTYIENGLVSSPSVTKANRVSTAQYGVNSGEKDWHKLEYVNEKEGTTNPSWSSSASSTTGYPAYPSADTIIADVKAKMQVVDLNGTGSGATVNPTFSVSHSQGISSSDGVESKYSETTVTLTGFTVTNPGAGYVQPVVRFYTSSFFLISVGVTRWEYDVKTQNAGLSVYVSDDTGSGAVLKPTVSGGRVTGISVISGGSGYSDPVVVFDTGGLGGSGASATVSVGTVGAYPNAVGYFEQRRIFAGLKNDPQRVVMTKSGTESDMSYSLPYRDDDRISFQIASREFNAIEHVVSLSNLLVLTTGMGFRISPQDGSVITPTSITAKPQSNEGASRVMPQIVNNSAVYCAARGGHVRELAYQYSAGGYVSSDLCLRSSHLFDFKTIKDSALSRAPIPILWFVSSDGSLLSQTYIPEQEVNAWAQHVTDGAFESVASVEEGDEDHLYAVIRRNINGQVRRYIERMSSQATPSIEDSFYVDSGAVYEGNPATVISGLTWLEGKTVSILADGAVMPQQAVVNGAITLSYPASKVAIGLPYTSDAQTLPVVMQDTAFGGGRMKNVTQTYLRVYKSSGVFAGPTFDESDLAEYKQRTTEQPGSPPALYTGELELRLFPAWQDSGAICVRQSDPLPLMIQSAVLTIST